MNHTRFLTLTLCLFLLVPMLFSCAQQPALTEAPTYDYDLSGLLTLPDYKTLSYTDEDLVSEAALDSRRKSDFAGKDMSRAVKDGDTVNIDYVGKRDGVPFDGGTAQGQSLKIGSDSYIAGFEDGLIGVMPGKTVDLNLTFPENYQNAELAGAAVVFTVTVNYIETDDQTLPELTDTLVATYTEYKTVAEYEEAIFAEIRESTLLSKVKNYLMLNTTFHKVPQAEQDYYYNAYINNVKLNAAQNGMTLDAMLSYYQMTPQQLIDEAKTYANSAVQEELVMYSVFRAENFEITEQMRNAANEELAESYGYATVEDMLKAVDEADVEKNALFYTVLHNLADAAVASK